jgi:hypothetical protein
MVLKEYMLSPGGGGDDEGVGFRQTEEEVVGGLGTVVLKPLRAREAMRKMFLKCMIDTEQAFNILILWLFWKF